MSDHRKKVWNDYLRTGRVRYRSAEYRCGECDRWHTVTTKGHYVPYDKRNETLEDQVLNALRTSGTGRCPHKKLRKAKAEKETPDDGPVDRESGTIG